MEFKQLRQLQAAEAAYHFLTQDPPPTSLANVSPSFQQLVSVLKGLIDTATARGTEQKVGPRRERYSARDAAAAQLDGTLRALRQVARVIAASKAGAGLAPNFASIVSVPATSNVGGMLQDAQSTVKQIAPYQALFIAHGQAPDFLDELTTQIQTVTALAKSANEARGAQLTATGDIDRLLREIRSSLRCLNVEVRRLCAKDGPQGKVTYQTWQKLKRPHQPSVPSDAATPVPATPVTAASATPTPTAA